MTNDRLVAIRIQILGILNEVIEHRNEIKDDRNAIGNALADLQSALCDAEWHIATLLEEQGIEPDPF